MNLESEFYREREELRERNEIVEFELEKTRGKLFIMSAITMILILLLVMTAN